MERKPRFREEELGAALTTQSLAVSLHNAGRQGELKDMVLFLFFRHRNLLMHRAGLRTGRCSVAGGEEDIQVDGVKGVIVLAVLPTDIGGLTTTTPAPSETFASWQGKEGPWSRGNSIHRFPGAYVSTDGGAESQA
ncbi:Succinate dehydrogenase [ubiquinone] iron-sulfur subunit 2, mitochondrial [Frankliniella fusca]|uniref:Succinate dehydrogenase [ubiquinone] iron-sulfur subunit 2, mitochondrial n=1 Tax=Frankliniella fusca TaxID=407009 RepID=A0AAE1LRB2_9NEOP|nr:Succinate dehydrogenase [ubiquinone] iron-sulfur subunit 2, mitochondrial [Frankliniella fusca]